MLEPWLRGTLTEVDAVRRQVLHALELAGEDAERWCAKLTDEAMCARPSGIASVCFHLRHLVRSLDRLLTYAEGRMLAPSQLELLAGELDCEATTSEVMREFRAGLERAATRVRAFDPDSYEMPRGVGRQGLPTTVGGLLVHCAEHTQRHIGQAITTAQFVGVLGDGSGAVLAVARAEEPRAIQDEGLSRERISGGGAEVSSASRAARLAEAASSSRNS